MHRESRATGSVVTFLLACLAVAGIVLVLFQPPLSEEEANDDGEAAAATWAPAVDPPKALKHPGAGISGRVDPEWVTSTSVVTGIPERALAAYAGAAIVKAKQNPSCGLSWNTIAAIGAVESDHGRHDGSVVGDDGTVSPAIYGIALDGETTADIPDSDEGAIDGDAKFDRAVGPMQLIPQTWRNWHVDGNGDGVEDPQNMDDAVLATANYLCRASTKLDTEAGWRAAVLAYNASEEYAAAVAAAALGFQDDAALATDDETEAAG